MAVKKKSTKKVAKKATKKASPKKLAKKVTKKASPKKVAKKVTKKAPTKKVAKKVTKKVTSKKVAKKATKKASPKKVAKKVTKKASPKKVAKKATKKASPKKLAKKVTKKASPKKVTKKVTKKASPKKVAKKVTKKASPKKVAKKATKKASPKKVAKKASAKTTDKPAKKVSLAKPSGSTLVKKVKRATKKKPIKPRKLTVFDKKQHQRLLDLRDELIDATSSLTQDTLKSQDGADMSGSGQHTADAGSDAYDRDIALRILSKEQDALYEIEEAINRVEKGVYGYCEISGEKIPKLRLEYIPFCRLTIEQQEKWEKKFGKQRFRKPDEPGYTGASL